MAGRASHLPIAVLILAFLASATARGPFTVTYFLQQRFGINELQIVPAARPAVNGTIAGFGTEVVFEYPMTKTSNASSKLLGYVRGTGIAVQNSVASTTFFVTELIHYDDGKLKGTISLQGEAVFSLPSWEYAVVGGTGNFKYVYGTAVGKTISYTMNPDGTSLFVTKYTARLFYNH